MCSVCRETILLLLLLFALYRDGGGGGGGGGDGGSRGVGCSIYLIIIYYTFMLW